MKTKNYLLKLLVVIVLASCTTVKKTTSTLHQGNYDETIALALEKLRKNPEKKSKQPYILLLEEAFAKAAQRDQERISFLNKEGNPVSLEEVYETYVTLRNRQERIKPILPLEVLGKNRNAQFDFKNYDNQLVSSKEALSKYLYAMANSNLTQAMTKQDYRSTYDDLAYLDRITPNYKNVKTLLEEVHLKGTDFVDVRLTNDTQMIIPERLENDLLDFSTYGLNNFWMVYHSTPVTDITYDYIMDVTLREINISPERIKEREISKEKQVKDGTEFLKDKDGNYELDDEGKKIEVDAYKTVYCDFYEFTQSKVVNVVGQVRYSNAGTNQLVESFPLVSEYIFEHQYGTYNGDKRALGDDLFGLSRNREIPFPSNEQMVYDAGEDLKQRLKNIITQYNN